MTNTPAMPELPETTYSLFYEEPGDIEGEGCQYVLDDPGYTADQMRAYALATLQAQPAEVSDAEIVAALEAAGVKFQRFMGGISGTKDCWSTSGSQDVRKLLAGIRAILALRPQAVPMTDDLANEFAREMVKGHKSVEWLVRRVEAHHGITAQGAQGEQA